MPGGRPTKRTPEARAAILMAVARGADYYTAAAMGDLAYQTFNEWRKADSEFSDEVEKTRARAAQDRIDAIAAAMLEPKHWTAAAWWLERRYKKTWGKVDTVELTTPKLRWPWEQEQESEQHTGNSNRVSDLTKPTPGTGNGSQESGKV